MVEQEQRREWAAWQLAILFSMSCASVLALYLPARGPLGEGLQDFSTSRAFAHVEAIASVPHPAGSPEQDIVRQTMIDRLREIGVEPELQEFESRGIALTNLIAHVPGTKSESTVLLMAHYDSRPGAPGAGDDASGTAALLESLRAVLASPKLQNDLVFLFTDGEEAGLLGAAEFVASHPLANEIDCVINIEAIGNSGPATMFETGVDNGWFIAEFARACEQPVASSLGKFVYDQMPNDTDFSCFRDIGVPGLNFAICSGSTVYHQATDLPENLSQNSLAHQGAMVLSLTRHFGSIDCRNRSEPDAIFFNLPGGPLLYWPSSWAMPITVLLCLIQLLRMAQVFRNKQWTSAQCALAGLKSIGSFLLISAAVIALWHILDLITGFIDVADRVDNTLSGTLTYLGLILATWSGWALVLQFYSERTSEVSVWLARAVFSGFALWFAWRAPAASYALFLPLAGAQLMPIQAETNRARLLQFLGYLPTVLLCLPVCCLIFMIASRALAPSVYATTILMTALGGLLLPVLAIRSGNSKRVAIGLCFLAAALLETSSFTRAFGL